MLLLNPHHPVVIRAFVGLFFAQNREVAVGIAALQALVAHGNPEAH